MYDGVVHIYKLGKIALRDNFSQRSARLRRLLEPSLLPHDVLPTVAFDAFRKESFQLPFQNDDKAELNVSGHCHKKSQLNEAYFEIYILIYNDLFTRSLFYWTVWKNSKTRI